MQIVHDQLMSLWDLENIPACDEGMRLAGAFLEAAEECVKNMGRGRTSATRSNLLTAYNWMVAHGDRCDKCNES